MTKGTNKQKLMDSLRFKPGKGTFWLGNQLFKIKKAKPARIHFFNSKRSLCGWHRALWSMCSFDEWHFLY